MFVWIKYVIIRYLIEILRFMWYVKAPEVCLSLVKGESGKAVRGE